MSKIQTSRLLFFIWIGYQQALIDAKGNVLWQGEYDPFGNPLRINNPKRIYQPIRMQGQHYDDESGLHYNRHRYYDAYSGRYITQDPIGLMGGINLYSYPLDPVRKFDPKGLNVWAWALPTAGGLAAADGPFPIGDALALVLLAGIGIYSLFNSIDCVSELASCQKLCGKAECDEDYQGRCGGVWGGSFEDCVGDVSN